MNNNKKHFRIQKILNSETTVRKFRIQKIQKHKINMLTINTFQDYCLASNTSNNKCLRGQRLWHTFNCRLKFPHGRKHKSYFSRKESKTLLWNRRPDLSTWFLAKHRNIHWNILLNLQDGHIMYMSSTIVCAHLCPHHLSNVKLVNYLLTAFVCVAFLRPAGEKCLSSFAGLNPQTFLPRLSRIFWKLTHHQKSERKRWRLAFSLNLIHQGRVGLWTNEIWKHGKLWWRKFWSCALLASWIHQQSLSHWSSSTNFLDLRWRTQNSRWSRRRPSKENTCGNKRVFSRSSSQAWPGWRATALHRHAMRRGFRICCIFWRDQGIKARSRQRKIIRYRHRIGPVFRHSN